jgi:regulator of protease activity HflC (stomatin/prohibitin superfamily)
MGAIIIGAMLGFLAYFIVRTILTGIYTVDQNERAVITTFGRAERLGGTTLEDPIAESLNSSTPASPASSATRSRSGISTPPFSR